jgi:hypothetical protein
MEEFVRQTFNFALIRIYKNYTNLDSKPEESEEICYENILSEKEEEDDDPFGIPSIQVKNCTVHAVPSTDGKIETLTLQAKDNKRKYFYTKNPNDSFIDHSRNGVPKINCEMIPILCCCPKNDAFVATKDIQIKRHYNNPFANIKIIQHDRWIKKDGDKITIKFYTGIRERYVNSKYFVKSAKSVTLVFNMKTGNFVVVNYNKNRRTKRIKAFYVNSFNSLETALGIIHNPQRKLATESPIFQSYMQTFGMTDFQLGIKNAFGFDGIAVAYGDIAVHDFITRWSQKFVELKKIKVPNEGTHRFLIWYYPTEKYLKKNNRKLIAAVLDRFGIKSDITIKILHKHPHTSLRDFVSLCRLFGNDYPKYVGGVDEHFFVNNERDNEMGAKQGILDNNYGLLYQISNNEKENMVRIINNMCAISPEVIRGTVDTFYDHFRMLERVKPYYPEMKLNARTSNSFDDEHSELSRIERLIRTGYSTHLIFENNIIAEIERRIEVNYLPEQPIWFCKDAAEAKEYEKKYNSEEYMTVQHKVFYPKILKTSDEYAEEGHHMHHCVAGYISKADRSIIISLRCGDDRVTMEFEVRTKRSLQARYMLNKQPPPYYEKAMNELYERIRRIPFSIAPIDKIKVPVVINGIPVAELKEELIDNPF